MNKLNQLGLFVIFSLFLTACDKPTPLSIETTADSSSTTDIITPDTGKEDYKLLREWQDIQEKELGNAITNTINHLDEKQKDDPIIIQETVNKVLLTQIEKIRMSAESLNIQNTEVKALKDKTIEVLTLGVEMLIEGEKMNKNPTDEAHKSFVELQTKLNLLAEEGQKLENSLKIKYESPSSSQ